MEWEPIGQARQTPVIPTTVMTLPFKTTSGYNSPPTKELRMVLDCGQENNKAWKQNLLDNNASRRSESQKFRKNCASGHPERLKFRKIRFRDAPTSCFLWKWTVGGPRSSKNLKNKLSGSPEARKIWKIHFRGIPKHQNFEKQAFGESRSLKILRNKLSGHPETYLSLIKL